MFHRHFDDYVSLQPRVVPARMVSGAGRFAAGKFARLVHLRRPGGPHVHLAASSALVILALIAEKRRATAMRSSRSSASGSGATIRQARASSIRP